MAEIPVNSTTRTIKLRGIAFPVDCIRAAMLETGGIVVSDDEINKVLDRALYATTADGKRPEMLTIEAIPAVVFIPKKIKVYHGLSDTTGTDTDMYLYFAVQKRFHA